MPVGTSSEQRTPFPRPTPPRGRGSDRVRRFFSDPVVQFLAAGLVALVVLVVASGWLSKRAATDEAIKIRDDIAFFQAIKAKRSKSSGSRRPGRP